MSSSMKEIARDCHGHAWIDREHLFNLKATIAKAFQSAVDVINLQSYTQVRTTTLYDT